mmetsp:Transcript_21769/g.61288  ORF Transcript_21769/g.61288 Transcript_21769/m.61288 type:complete len:204 (-) Transcript_21769:229-840(-)
MRSACFDDREASSLHASRSDSASLSWFDRAPHFSVNCDASFLIRSRSALRDSFLKSAAMRLSLSSSRRPSNIETAWACCSANRCDSSQCRVFTAPTASSRRAAATAASSSFASARSAALAAARAQRSASDWADAHAARSRSTSRPAASRSFRSSAFSSCNASMASDRLTNSRSRSRLAFAPPRPAARDRRVSTSASSAWIDAR